jgi:acetyltransferase-like isoleucine patch superfamily enzyme
VVAAGAVVRGELEAYGIYAGVPARLVRMRAPTTTYLKDHRHDLDPAEAAAAFAAP